MSEETMERLKKMIKWIMIIAAIISAFAFLYSLWIKQQQSQQPSPPAPQESPNAESNEPIPGPADDNLTQEEFISLDPAFEPTIVREGEEQKLALKITNKTKKALVIQEAKIDWYWDQGEGFYLAEQQRIANNDSHWLATRVPAGSTKTVYLEASKASGRGEWQGKITVVTDLKSLASEVTHTIQ